MNNNIRKYIIETIRANATIINLHEGNDNMNSKAYNKNALWIFNKFNDELISILLETNNIIMDKDILKIKGYYIEKLYSYIPSGMEKVYWYIIESIEIIRGYNNNDI